MGKTILALAATLLVAGGASAEDVAAADDGVTNAYDFEFHAQATALYTADGRPWSGPTFEEGEVVKLADYAGQPILVVNTAAHCGFTPQFEGLQSVYEQYRDKGLVVIGVHANNFREQGGSEAELAEQCGIYHVDFPQMQMVDVVGENSHPFYAWVREETGDRGFPGWNFNKVLIGPDGGIRATFGSGNIVKRAEVQPELVEAIEAALGRS